MVMGSASLEKKVASGTYQATLPKSFLELTCSRRLTFSEGLPREYKFCCPRCFLHTVSTSRCGVAFCWHCRVVVPLHAVVIPADAIYDPKGLHSIAKAFLVMAKIAAGRKYNPSAGVLLEVGSGITSFYGSYKDDTASCFLFYFGKTLVVSPGSYPHKRLIPFTALRSVMLEEASTQMTQFRLSKSHRGSLSFLSLFSGGSYVGALRSMLTNVSAKTCARMGFQQAPAHVHKSMSSGFQTHIPEPEKAKC